MYRVDFFKNTQEVTTTHIKRHFESLEDAMKAALEGRRDGFNVYLLEQNITGYFDIKCQIV